jgi:hypothetical protein
MARDRDNTAVSLEMICGRRIIAEVNAGSATCDRDIGPVVHEDFRSVKVGNFQDFPGKSGEVPPAEIAFAKLNQFYSRSNPVRDVRKPV